MTENADANLVIVAAQACVEIMVEHVEGEMLCPQGMRLYINRFQHWWERNDSLTPPFPPISRRARGHQRW